MGVLDVFVLFVVVLRCRFFRERWGYRGLEGLELFKVIVLCLSFFSRIFGVYLGVLIAFFSYLEVVFVFFGGDRVIDFYFGVLK